MISSVRSGFDDHAVASIVYMKDGRGEGTKWKFGLREFPLVDSKGRTITTKVVDLLSDPTVPEPAAQPDQSSRAGTQGPKGRKVMRDAIIEALDSTGQTIQLRGGRSVRAVKVEHVKAEFLQRYVCDGTPDKAADTAVRTFRRELAKLSDAFETTVRDKVGCVYTRKQ